MNVQEKEIKLSAGQQRLLKLLFKFRFMSTQLLADVIGIGRRSVYEAVEVLVAKGLVDKVYDSDFRYAKKPAYYYLNKQGVTTVRRLLDVKESVVHALYKNAEASPEFIDHCLTTARCYGAIKRGSPDDTEIFTKAEINRFRQFPKNRPYLYIRTPGNKDAIVVIIDDKPLYIVRKRLEEIIQHMEDEGWDGDYPTICFILKNPNDLHSFLYTTNKKLEAMGMDENEVTILATHLEALRKGNDHCWSNPFHPKSFVRMFE